MVSQANKREIDMSGPYRILGEDKLFVLLGIFGYRKLDVFARDALKKIQSVAQN